MENKIQIYPRLQYLLIFVESLALAVIVAGFVITALGYSKLSQEIPIHFDGSGMPDRFRNRIFIWVLPGASLLLYLFTSFVSYIPRLLNRAVVNNDMQNRLYLRARLLLALVKLIGAIVITYLTILVIWFPKWLTSSIMIIVGLLLFLMSIGFLLYWNYRR